MPKNTTASSCYLKKNAQAAQLSDENSEDGLSDGLQNDNGDTDEETTNQDIMKRLLQQTTGKKSLGHSKAFHTQKNALYGEARKNGKELVRDGIAFLEDAQGKLTDFYTQEISFEKYYQDFHIPLTAQQESVKRAQKLYPPLLESLGLQRSNQVDAACNMLKKKGPQRQEALKEFCKCARAQVEQARQNEKDAADASALIKGYKALQRS